MKNSLKVLISIILIFVSLFCIFIFRVLPSVKIWDSYSVFYVDKSLNIDILLEEYNGKGVISLFNQEYPKNNELTPIMEEFTLRNFSSKEIRDVFFYDLDKKYQLLYVENNQVNFMLDFFKKNDIPFGTDAKSTVPIICPIICFLLILFLCIFSKSKMRYFLAKLPFVLFSYAIPHYSVAIAICCFLCFFFVIELFIDRSDWKRIIKKKPLIILFGLFSLILICLCGIRAIVFFILSLFASGGILFLFSLTPHKNLYGFSMKNILPVFYINDSKRLNLKFFGICFSFVLILSVLFIFSSFFTTDISENNLFLPAPSEYTSDVYNSSLEESYKYVKSNDNVNSNLLPNIFDFTDEKWFQLTYPYRILDSDTKSNYYLGDVINFPKYTKSNNGLVIQEMVELYKYDEDFLNQSIVEFNNTSGIEQLLVSQQPYTNIVYSSGGKTKITNLMWIVVFLGVILLGSITLICLIKRQFK